MCESTAYMRFVGGGEEVLLEDVVTVVPESGRITLTNLLGDRKTVEGEIDHIDLQKHRIVLRPKT